MPKNHLMHTIGAELRYQLTQTALDMRDAQGSWDRMVLGEQYDTLCRFLDHPHAVPEAPPLRPEQLIRGRRYLR